MSGVRPASSHVTSGAATATTDMAARGGSRSGASLVSLVTVVTLFGAAATLQRKVRNIIDYRREEKRPSLLTEVRAVSRLLPLGLSP